MQATMQHVYILYIPAYMHAHIRVCTCISSTHSSFMILIIWMLKIDNQLHIHVQFVWGTLYIAIFVFNVYLGPMLLYCFVYEFMCTCTCMWRYTHYCTCISHLFPYLLPPHNDVPGHTQMVKCRLLSEESCVGQWVQGSCSENWQFCTTAPVQPPSRHLLIPRLANRKVGCADLVCRCQTYYCVIYKCISTCMYNKWCRRFL